MPSPEEIRNRILARLYLGVYADMGYCLPLLDYADQNGIGHDTIEKCFNHIEEEGLAICRLTSFCVEPTTRGLLYVEEHGLVDAELIQRHRRIRSDLLDTLFYLEEKKNAYELIRWERWCEEAHVEKEAFNKHRKIMVDTGMIEKSDGFSFRLTPLGRNKVIDLRRRRQRAEKFDALRNLEEVTPQQRGHRLEDLLADSAEWEEWQVSRRPRAQGTENDLILRTGLHYFIISCKWEADPVQAKEAELLESRVRRRPPANAGLLFSMSGFTPNCIEEIRLMSGSTMIIPFGPVDIRGIMHNENIMTDLLIDKMDSMMDHRLILVDGEAI